MEQENIEWYKDRFYKMFPQYGFLSGTPKAVLFNAKIALPNLKSPSVYFGNNFRTQPYVSLHRSLMLDHHPVTGYLYTQEVSSDSTQVAQHQEWQAIVHSVEFDIGTGRMIARCTIPEALDVENFEINSPEKITCDQELESYVENIIRTRLWSIRYPKLLSNRYQRDK